MNHFLLNQTHRFLAPVLLVFLLGACEEDREPIGNPNLAIDSLGVGGPFLLGDTLTLYGQDFDPLTYQNRVAFLKENLGDFVDGVPTFEVRYRELSSFDPDFEVAGLAKVTYVSNDRSELRAVVPLSTYDPVVSGPVRIVFGVDTVFSSPVEILPFARPRLYESLLSTTEGTPGATITFEKFNTLNPAEDSFIPVDAPVVAYFGEQRAATGTDAEGNTTIIIPDVLDGQPGQVPVRIGYSVEGVEYLSKDLISFILLPIAQDVPPAVWFVKSGGSVVIGKSLPGGAPGTDTLFERLGGNLADIRGIVRVRDQVYWAQSTQGGGTALLRSPLNIPPKVKKAGNYVQEYIISNNTVGVADLAADNSDQIYVLVRSGIVARVDATQPNPQPERLFGAVDLAKRDDLRNLKLAGNWLYWCGDSAVTRGSVANPVPGSLKTLYTLKDVEKVVPIDPTLSTLANNQITALAVDGQNGLVYFAFVGKRFAPGGDVHILRGSVDGTADLEEVDASASNRFIGVSISDMEIYERSLYLLNEEENSTVYRVSLPATEKVTDDPIKVYQGMGPATRFDLPG